MALFDLDDFATRMIRLLPRIWFSDAARAAGGMLYAIKAGFGDGLAFVYQQIQTLKANSRLLMTQDMQVLALYSRDFFGGALPPLAGETVDQFRARILARLLLPGGTREGVRRSLFNLLGANPALIEPWNPNDTGAWDSYNFAYDAAGYWGDLELPWLGLICANRPSAVASNGQPYYCAWDECAGFDTFDAYYPDLQPLQVVPDSAIYSAIEASKLYGTRVFLQLDHGLPGWYAGMSSYESDAYAAAADWQRGTLGTGCVVSGNALAIGGLDQSFTRSTPAYDPYTGAEVAADVPRFPTAGGVQGVMVEQGTTNLLTANQSSVETDTTGFGSYLSTISRDTSVSWSGAASLKVVCDGTGANQGFVTDTTPASPSTVYTASIWIWGSGSIYMQFVERDSLNSFVTATSGSNINLSNTPQRVTLTVTTNASTAYVYIEANTVGTQATTFWVDGLQIEQSPNATSWQLGGTPRAAESLAIPVATALNPGAGSVAVEFYADGPITNTASNKACYLFGMGEAGGKNDLAVWYNTASQAWYVYSSNGAATGTTVTAAAAPPTKGLHTGVLTFDATEIVLSIDGVDLAYTSTPNLPSAIPATMYIGGDRNGAEPPDMSFTGIRLGTSKLSSTERAAITPATGLPDAIHAPMTGQTYAADYKGDLSYVAKGTWTGPWMPARVEPSQMSTTQTAVIPSGSSITTTWRTNTMPEDSGAGAWGSLTGLAPNCFIQPTVTLFGSSAAGGVELQELVRTPI